MGKSPKPLSFYIDQRVVGPDDKPRLDALQAQGHTVDVITENDPMYHREIILGPNCWRAFDLQHLDLAMKSARAVKYVKKSEAKPKKPRAARKKKGDSGPEPE